MSQHDSPPTGKVLILLAADRVTGPAKGLFQLLRHARGRGWTFLLGLFHLREAGPVSECAELADRLAVPYVVLEQRRRFDPGLVWRMRRLVRDQRVTLLQSHSYKGHLVALLLRRLTGLPWLAFAHGWTDENWRIRMYNRLDFRLLRHPDVVVAVSQDIRRRLDLSGVQPSRITVVPNAVDISTLVARADGASWRASIGVSPKRPIVTVIGRLSPEKGQDVFLQACSIVAQRGHDFVAVLVGEGPSEATLRTQIRASDLNAIARLAGYCHDVGTVYQESDIIVIPSRSEGLPNVLLEAMALGKPIIATQVGGISEVLRDGTNGRLVPNENPADMARVMCALLQSSEQRAFLGRNAAATARVFSPEKRAERIADLYATLTRLDRQSPNDASVRPPHA